jgi:uncharacterized membrane protein
MLRSGATTPPPRARFRGWRPAEHLTPARGTDISATPQIEEAAPPLAGRAGVPIGLLAFSGFELVLTSEIVDLLEGLEDGAGVGWLNLTLAVMFATIAVCAAGLAGDTALQAVERRTGYRPRAHLITPLLGTSATATTSGILLAHLSRPLSLDSWTGLAGSLLLLIAVIAHHHLPRTTQPRPRNRATQP